MSAPASSSDREFRSVLCPTVNKLQSKPLSKPVKKKVLTFTPHSSPPLCPSSSSNASLRRKKALRRNASLSSSSSANLPGERGGDCFADGRRRCSWITPKSDESYITFHDEEWGVPVHDDKTLFELLSLSGALAELSWKDILSKRHLFRQVFMDFDPLALSQLTNRKETFSLLSEQKLLSIFENANQVCKLTDEFGSFEKYIWNFVNGNPIQSLFRYPRQVPLKTSKAELISKDLIRRGFRSVSPTVIYSFMQAAGLTNDHLTNCFRHQECISKGSDQ